ncbi:MFS transporter [Emcibacter sp. SYSU 3D8]|uniref:spinster family MFS transporter n=1 Tax=Emcibacter sp. SYSU 3D8 TaxID=3133969 RepID=UPI0031FE5D99
MTAVAAVNFLDRQILGVLLEPIREEFGLADWVLGLLTGFAFAVFYASLGIPIAALADRFSRRNIIVICTGIFSVMTAVCGGAQNFWHLFLARIGVGVGEAGTMPASQSIISNLFPIQSRAAAMGLLATGGNIGLMLGLLIGGWVNEWWGWRWAFAAAAIPGLLLAAGIWLTVKEPKRPYNPDEAAGTRPHVVAETIASIAYMARVPSIRWFTAGGALYGLTGYGLYTFMPSYFIRYHDFSTGEAGTVISIMTGVLGAIGTFLGGYICAKLAARRGLHWNGWLPAVAIVLSAPFMITMLLSDNAWLVIGLFIVPGFLSSVYAGPTWAIIQELVSPGRRAMAASVYMLIYNLIALGLGPVFTGTVSSVIEPYVGDQSLRYAMVAVVMISLGGAFAYVMASRSVTRDIEQLRSRR